MKSNDTATTREDDHQPTISTLDSRFNQTLRNVQGLLRGRSFPGKVLLTRRSDPLDGSTLRSPDTVRGFSDNYTGSSEQMDESVEDEVQSRSAPNTNSTISKLKSSTSSNENASKEVQKSTVGARATDSARLMKFRKELAGPTVILEKLRELAWSGVPPYLRPTVWRLLLV